jgi:hypothetical protein
VPARKARGRAPGKKRQRPDQACALRQAAGGGWPGRSGVRRRVWRAATAGVGRRRQRQRVVGAGSGLGFAGPSLDKGGGRHGAPRHAQGWSVGVCCETCERQAEAGAQGRSVARRWARLDPGRGGQPRIVWEIASAAGASAGMDGGGCLSTPGDSNRGAPRSGRAPPAASGEGAVAPRRRPATKLERWLSRPQRLGFLASCGGAAKRREQLGVHAMEGVRGWVEQRHVKAARASPRVSLE